jgi:hypothetical protein
MTLPTARLPVKETKLTEGCLMTPDASSGGEMNDLQQILGESSASESDREAFGGSDGSLRGRFEEDGVTCDQCDGVVQVTEDKEVRNQVKAMKNAGEDEEMYDK